MSRNGANESIPANLEVERWTLASMLDEPERSEWRGLTPDDFSREAYRRIFRACQSLNAKGLRVGTAAIIEELRAAGQLKSVGGVEGVVDLDRGLPRICDQSSNVRILHEKTTLRRALFAADALRNRCLLSDAKPSDIHAEALALAAGVSERASSRGAIVSIEQVPAPEDCGTGDVIWVHEPELAEGTVTALTGSAECGKSHIAMMHAREAMATGRHVVILDRESPLHTAIDRMRRLGVASGVLFHYFGGWLGEVPALDSTLVLEWIRKTPRPLIILDSLSAFFGGNQNDAGEMRCFTDGARRLADLGAAVEILHHDGKASSAKIYRGSSDFVASIDQGFHVENFSPDGGRHLHTITLQCFKSRFGFSGDLMYRYANGRMLREESAVAQSRSVSEQLFALLRSNPGIRQKDFEDLAGTRQLGRNRARAFLESGVSEGTVERRLGPKNAKYFFLKAAADD